MYRVHFISLYIIFSWCFAPPPFIGLKRKGEETIVFYESNYKPPVDQTEY